MIEKKILNFLKMKDKRISKTEKKNKNYIIK